MSGKNTYKVDRTEYSGAFFDTLTDPLFVVKQKYINEPGLSANARNNANSKWVQPKDEKIIAENSLTFFKPYKKGEDKNLLYFNEKMLNRQNVAQNLQNSQIKAHNQKIDDLPFV